MTEQSWTDEELDYMMLEVLKANSKEELNGTFDRVAEKLERVSTSKPKGKAIAMHFHRIAVGVAGKDYHPIGSASFLRSGLPATYAEIEFIKQATASPTDEDKKRIDSRISHERLAELLRRTRLETSDLINKHGPARGRTGFNAPPLKME